MWEYLWAPRRAILWCREGNGTSVKSYWHPNSSNTSRAFPRLLEQLVPRWRREQLKARALRACLRCWWSKPSRPWVTKVKFLTVSNTIKNAGYIPSRRIMHNPQNQCITDLETIPYVQSPTAVLAMWKLECSISLGQLHSCFHEPFQHHLCGYRVLWQQRGRGVMLPLCLRNIMFSTSRYHPGRFKEKSW